MLVLATAFAVISISVVSAFLAPHRPTRAKYSAYESGIEPGRLPQGERFPVKFYLTAMLFVVFDVEVIFLYPWAVRVPPAGRLRAGPDGHLRRADPDRLHL